MLSISFSKHHEQHLDLHLFTEQELRSYDAAILSELILHSQEHYADGFTVRIEGSRKFIFGIEVELHLKSFNRYAQVLQCYMQTKAQVLWLCGLNYIAQRVRSEFSELSSRPETVNARSFQSGQQCSALERKDRSL